MFFLLNDEVEIETLLKIDSNRPIKRHFRSTLGPKERYFRPYAHVRFPRKLHNDSLRKTFGK